MAGIGRPADKRASHVLPHFAMGTAWEAVLADDWILLPDAITAIADARAIPRSEAIPLTVSLAKNGEVGSRIALEVNRSEGQPHRNVPMSDAHWRDLETLDTAWIDTGNAEFIDGYAWRGIQIHAGDLALSHPQIGPQSQGKLQPVAYREGSEEFDEPKADWLELWQGPLHFRATFDKGRFGLGHTLERINQYALEASTGGGRHEPIYSVRLDPSDGAIVIKWLIGAAGQKPRVTSYYNGALSRKLYERLRDDQNFRDQHLAHLPSSTRPRAVGAYACGITIREWAEREFFEAIHAGHCEIWARVGSKVARFRRVPSDVFHAYKIRSWGYGRPGGAWADLGGAEPLFAIHVAPSHRSESSSISSVAVERFTYDEVVSWCRDWIASGKGNGMDKAWLAFQRLPNAKGCARDTFFRPAWNEAKTKAP